jgi:glutamine amidotransferase
MSTVAIIDYGMCNLDSVARAVEECGGVPKVTDQSRDLAAADRIILPGVGAFPEAMRNLRNRGLHTAMEEQVLENQIPVLGICLGMQMLAERGTEGGETEGLGWIKGEVRRLRPSQDDPRIPHIGWSEVLLRRSSPLFEGIESGSDFYFVHSYAVVPSHSEDTLGFTPYGCGFVSAVQKNLIFGVQFHPEKSQRIGFRLLKNFLNL